MSRPRYDLVVLADLRFPGGTSTALATEIRTQAAAGYRTGLVHVKGPVLRLPHPFHPEFRALLDAAGLASPDIAEMPLEWRFPGLDAYWRFLTEMAGAISPVLRTLTPEAQAAVRARWSELAEPFRADDGYALPALCLNVATRRPA